MEKKIILTTFTDPMMGLSYECEPTFRKLETNFGNKIEFRYNMSLLVRDVQDFMMPEELSMPLKEGLIRYNKRLAKIYKNEEELGGLPMSMENLRLFDEKHRSTMPLNLAYKAVEHIAPELASEFLYRLRFATIALCQPTTHIDEILPIVEQIGIDIKKFQQAQESEKVHLALEKDIRLCADMGIRGLPAYLLQYGDSNLLINRFITYDTFAAAIGTLTKNRIQPRPAGISNEALKTLLNRHPLISSVEIKEAFDLKDIADAEKWIQPLVERKEV